MNNDLNSFGDFSIDEYGISKKNGYKVSVKEIYKISKVHHGYMEAPLLAASSVSINIIDFINAYDFFIKNDNKCLLSRKPSKRTLDKTYKKAIEKSNWHNGVRKFLIENSKIRNSVIQ